MQNPQASDFDEWKSHPFTQRYLKFIYLRREKAKEAWAKGQFEGDSLDSWALKNAKALGGVDAMDQILDLDMQDILDAEKESNEQVRHQSGRLDGTSSPDRS